MTDRTNVRRPARRAAGAALAVAIAASVAAVAAPAQRAAATPSSGFQPIAPVRLVDTRTALGTGLVAGVERVVAVAGVNVVPSTATRVAVKLVSTDATAYGQVRIHPCGAYNPAARAVLPVRPGMNDQTLALPPLQAGAFCVTSTAATQLVVDVAGYEGGGGNMAFVATAPKTVLDDVSVAAEGVTTVQITGSGGVASQTVPNLVTVSLGDDDRVCFYTSQPAHLLADLSGWYVLGSGDGLVTRAPTRLFDTRLGVGLLRAGTTFEWDLSGTVDAQTSAVIMNVTVTEPTAPGFVTVYPCSAGRPTASNLNYVARQTVPNLVTVAVGADRRVCFYVSGATQLLADLAGSYSSSSSAASSASTLPTVCSTLEPRQP
jgi:hypothetical protein